jgi:hypothetical protein
MDKVRKPSNSVRLIWMWQVVLGLTETLYCFFELLIFWFIVSLTAFVLMY